MLHVASLQTRAPSLPSNDLLAALSTDVRSMIEPALEPIQLELKTLLFEPRSAIAYAYFPETAIISLINTLGDGRAVEVGTVGREGFTGLAAIMGDGISTATGIVQVPGRVQRIPVATLLAMIRESDELERLLLRYAEAFIVQVSQTATCNACHIVVQRCARSLLMTHDRVPGDNFPLTHQFLAYMLGVRRAGVTIALNALESSGVIRNHRRTIAVIDRPGLEAASCECYGTVRDHFERLLRVPG